MASYLPTRADGHSRQQWCYLSNAAGVEKCTTRRRLWAHTSGGVRGPRQDLHGFHFRPITICAADADKSAYGQAARARNADTPTGARNGRQVDRRRVRSAMLGLGLDEVMPLPFLAPGDLERAGLTAAASL